MSICGNLLNIQATTRGARERETHKVLFRGTRDAAVVVYVPQAAAVDTVSPGLPSISCRR